ncbi:LD-carboxypeptidase [Brochothrix campestris]|uniref:Putative microcin C7 self-immunity protein (MccF) n=1 Tax=Brochothrix campestris FSL F6-1037 TaxID=1265861 RepID=W7CYB7_9LIST|nr:LD-carboxypeptidase [Brochothrix campestris]EUJ41937.1 putative microcin C7 self-immunity protein (MccF) [Brochothrix campestris FSL F6-1037]
MLKNGDTIGLIACSNGRPRASEIKLKQIEQFLADLGIQTVRAATLFACEGQASGTAHQRAVELAKLYQDDKIKLIFDISGGDLANQVLPFIDFDIIKQTKKPLVGLSDLTTLLNAIWQKTAVAGYYFQLMTLAGSSAATQQQQFIKQFMSNGSLPSYHFVRNEQTFSGIVYGGNIRCLLKLAGTSYWPKVNKGVLLLEGLSGNYERNATYVAQLAQLNVFNNCVGVVLGTFSELDKTGSQQIEQLLADVLPPGIPLVRTAAIGHGDEAGVLPIGHEVTFKS